MSTDFSKIGALDNEKKGWGPGGPTDEKKRPDGATVYQQQYGGYDAYFIAPDNNEIYLTFDQGYENGYTSTILDVLKEKDCKAVFFLTYPYARDNPELVQRMIDEGHILGNHSTNHQSFPDLPLETAAEDIIFMHNYIKDNFDYEMSLFRYPMGEFSERSLAMVQTMGYKSVFWSFAYRDWLVDDQPDPETAYETMCSKAHPGAIYLIHSVSSTNAEILGSVIDNFRDQGYTIGVFDTSKFPKQEPPEQDTSTAAADEPSSSAAQAGPSEPDAGESSSAAEPSSASAMEPAEEAVSEPDPVEEEQDGEPSPAEDDLTWEELYGGGSDGE